MSKALIAVSYRFGHLLVRIALLLLVNWRVNGRANVPRSGGAILVSNHLSMADPPLVALAMGRRRVVFMAKVEIFRLPWGIVPRLYGAIPVRRFKADAAALLRAERTLREGHILGMFPEGTRGRPGSVQKMRLGTALLALRTGSPIIPVAISGTEALGAFSNYFRRPPITVTVGQLIPVVACENPTRADLEQLTATVREAVERLYLETNGSSIPATAASGATP